MCRFWILCLCTVLALVYGFTTVFADCSYNGRGSVATALNDCKPKGTLDAQGDDYHIENGIKKTVVKVANNLITLGAFAAIVGIIWASFIFVMARGDDGKVKNARNGIIFSLVGFAVMLVAYPFVNAIINLVFSVSSMS